MVDYFWPEAKDRKLIGQRISRLDGPAKVTGAAKYTYDLRFPGMLHARFVRCPHAHARITKLDTSAAEAMPGVKAIHLVQGEGKEVQWALDEIVAIAAVSPMVSVPIGPMSRDVGTVLWAPSKAPSTTSKRMTLFVWS